MWRILKSVFFIRRILPHTKVLPDGKFGQINWKKTASMQRMQIMIFYLKLYTNAQRISWCPRQG